MGREKRKKVVKNNNEVYSKKSKKEEDEAIIEEPTDEEVEQFFLLLRRMKEATEYFGGGKRMLPESFRAVVGVAKEEAEMPPAVKDGGTSEEMEKEERIRRGKGKEVVVENGLLLDLNIAVAVESDGG